MGTVRTDITDLSLVLQDPVTHMILLLQDYNTLFIRVVVRVIAVQDALSMVS
jgi:hypothetical protein